MLIKVRVRTGARKEKVVISSADHFEVSVREKPENNMANKRVISLIADQFHVPIKAVRIVKGHHQPSKILSISPQLV
jgi:uncharacterized protein YggU (UPF0235/DUF167 family)